MREVADNPTRVSLHSGYAVRESVVNNFARRNWIRSVAVVTLSGRFNSVSQLIIVYKPLNLTDRGIRC